MSAPKKIERPERHGCAERIMAAARMGIHGCAECKPDTPEDELCGWCLLALNEERAGRALLKLAVEEGEHDPDDVALHVGPEEMGRLMIRQLITRGCSDLEKALAYVGLKRESQTVDVGRLRRLAEELRETAGPPDERNYGQGEPDPESWAWRSLADEQRRVADEIEAATGGGDLVERFARYEIPVGAIRQVTEYARRGGTDSPDDAVMEVVDFLSGFDPDEDERQEVEPGEPVTEGWSRCGGCGEPSTACGCHLGEADARPEGDAS